jgi:hypothetical protein
MNNFFTYLLRDGRMELHTSRILLWSQWTSITCLAQASSLSPARGTFTRSCFNRPTRNSCVSSLRCDIPVTLCRSRLTSRCVCNHTMDLPTTYNTQSWNPSIYLTALDENLKFVLSFEIPFFEEVPKFRPEAGSAPKGPISKL